MCFTIDLGHTCKELASYLLNGFLIHNTLTVVYVGNESEEIVINVTDVSGKILHRKPVAVIGGENFIPLLTEFQSSGVYLVEVLSKSGRQVFRLVVN
jgi:hypothetical protein